MLDPRAALERSAKATEQAFSRVGGRLSDVRGGLTDLCARLADLDGVLNDQRANARILEAVEDSAGALKAALVCGSQAAAPERLVSAALAATAALADIASRTRELDAVASLTRITANSLHLTGFEDYVLSLRRLGAAMGEDAQRMNQAVATLRARRERAGALFHQADAALSRVIGALADFAAERAATDRLLTASLDATRKQALCLPDIAATETDGLVRAMQFSDAVAQRLDHAHTILTRGDAASRALARAQIEAMALDAQGVAKDVLACLHRVDSAVVHAAQALSADAGAGQSPAARALELGRQVLTALIDGTALALAAIEGAAEESAGLQALSETASARFASVVRATDAIQLAAINATLLSHRDDRQEKAMSVLSLAVRHQAEACSALSGTCRQALAALSLAQDFEAFGAVAARAQTFRLAVADATTALDTAGAAVTQLDRLRQAAVASLRNLEASSDVARAAMQQILATADDLSQLAATLPRALPPDAGPMPDVMDLYTMEAERAVHRRLFGLPEVEAQKPAPASDDDLLSALLF